MRKESRKRPIHRWRHELVAWLPAVAVVAAVGASAVVFQIGKRETLSVFGTVEHANWRLNSDTGQQYPFIEARLDSGDIVRVGTVALGLPEIGSRIKLRRRSVLFDYMTTYYWNGRAPTPAKATVAPGATPVSLH
ncbi:hypothetical protein [Hyphomicrobium sp.]|uniref:hypothetical protein n=1 Tax=Hyphomicrobium sp. TaxID=82 RepID=UPI002E2F7BA9|nr:hypothetical protein [Hyphomicrobium sp.]HEX2839836.1 hypothetical protein [Hyphomicrobium sp.]